MENRLRPASEEYSWVWQIDVEIGREVSTRDTAVSEHFYGRDTTIEDQLADVETRWANALRDAEALDDPTPVSEPLREFAWILAIRGKALRNQFSEFAERLLEAAVQGKHEVAIKAALLKRAQDNFDDDLEDALSELPADVADQTRATINASRVWRIGEEHGYWLRVAEFAVLGTTTPSFALQVFDHARTVPAFASCIAM